MLGCAAATVVACGPAPAVPLSQVHVAPGFTLANQQPVNISIGAGTSVVMGGTALVSLEQEDGTVFYRGQLRSSQTLSLKLPVPVRSEAVVAVLSGPHGLTRLRIPVADGAATGSFP